MNGKANDLSGNNNDGKLIGGVSTTTDRFGNKCGALFFNGLDGHIEVPNSKSLMSISDKFSVTFWFKLIDSVYSGQNLRNLTVICKGTQPTENLCMPQYRVQLFQFEELSTVSINTELTEYDSGFKQHRIPVNEWTFFALVYDGKSIKAYLNNKEFWSYPYEKVFNCVNHEPLHIGKDIPGSTEYFHGALDNLKLYRGALTRKEVISEYKSPQNISSVSSNKNLNCPEDQVYYTSPYSCLKSVRYTQPGIDDDCIEYSIEQIAGFSSGSTVGVGSHRIGFKANTTNGSSKTCFFNIQVLDTIPPTIYCPKDTILTAQDRSGIRFEAEKVTGFDNCKLKSIDQVKGPSRGEMLKPGKHNYTYQARDESNNLNQCNFSITVLHKKIDTTANILDTASTSIASISDSLSIEEDNPEISDSIDIQHDIELDECLITIQLYDDQQQDYDTVSIFLDNEIIVDRMMIKNKGQGVISRLINLEPNVTHTLLSKAWNTGTVGPNTLTMDIFLGDETKVKTRLLRKKTPFATRIIHSKPGISGGITLKCEP
jgi:hypothetical protein